MTQNKLYREVANATGETVTTIRQMGFSMIIVPPRFHVTRPGGIQSRMKQPRNVPSNVQPKVA